MRWLLYVLALLIVLLGARVADAQVPDLCKQGVRCISLFEAMQPSLHGNAPVFVNPQVTATLYVSSPDARMVRVYVPDYGDDLRVIRPDGGKCPLVVAGIADDNGDGSLMYEDIPANQYRTRGLYTFCINVGLTNLPGDPRAREEATNAVGFYSTDFAYVLDSWTTNATRLRSVIERARDGTCSRNQANPLTWNSFATQLAAFIAVDPQPDDLSPWQFYGATLHNLDFLDEYPRIYCLLDQDAPQPSAGLVADPDSGPAPLTIHFSDTSSGDIAGYAVVLVNQDDTAVFTATGTVFPTDLDQMSLDAGLYQARLTVYGPPASYRDGAVTTQPVSTASAVVRIYVPPSPTARDTTATPTASPTTVPAFQQIINGTPFPGAPGLTGRNALLIVAAIMAGSVGLFALFSGGIFSTLLRSRRLLAALLLLALVAAFLVWLRPTMPSTTTSVPALATTVDDAGKTP